MHAPHGGIAHRHSGRGPVRCAAEDSSYAGRARLEELDRGHGRVVTPAEAVAQHARVAAVAVGVALGRRLEESVHELLVVDVAERLPPRVQRPICKVNRGGVRREARLR